MAQGTSLHDRGGQHQCLAGSLHIPDGLKEILEKNQLSPPLIERMTPSEWKEFENRCGKEVPFGLLLQVRYAIRDRLEQAEEELASANFKNDKNMIKKAHKKVGKLFHGDEGIGTIIYVGEAVGLCAFHSVHVKKSHTILESSLSVDGYGLEFMVAYPDLDIALYSMADGDGAKRQGPFMDLENDSFMFEGNSIGLLSFPAFDSQSRDEEDEDPMLICGSISKLQLDKSSSLAVGHYSTFPNTSGGAVISERGKLLGVHVEILYQEDHSFYRPPLSPGLPKSIIHPPLPSGGGPIPELMVQKQQLTTVKQEEEDEEISGDDDKENVPLTNKEQQDMLRFVVSNMGHKGSLGTFVPVYHLREILKKEGVIVAAKRGSSSQPGRKKISRHT